MSDRYAACPPIAVPAGFASETDGLSWYRDQVGESGCEVYRLTDADRRPLRYLKHGRGPQADDLIDEYVRLHWLQTRIDVPAIGGFLWADAEAWLLTAAVHGLTAYQLLEQGDESIAHAIVDAAADYLRRLHALSIQDCPFNAGHAIRLARAQERMEQGLVEEDDFDEVRLGQTPEALWKRLSTLTPDGTELVVTHGDYSLDNLILPPGGSPKCIDVGRLGVADRYQDVAIAWNSLGEFGADLQHRFLLRYGIAKLDARRLEFHLTLDEFF